MALEARRFRCRRRGERLSHGSRQARPADAGRHGLAAAAVAVLFLALLGFAGSAATQTGDQGSIEGLARDQSGAVIPGVRVSVQQLETGLALTTRTNDTGLFRFPVLPVGTYRVRAECDGFAALAFDLVELRVGARVTLPLVFTVAAHLVGLTVRAETPVIELSRSQVSGTVDSHAINSLPVNGRDFTSFALLLPSVATDSRGGLSFGGQRAMNSLLVDGINADDDYWGQAIGGEGFPVIAGQAGYHLALDTVKEFQVNVNAYSAELGRAGGGVVNVITRSGGDVFSGTVYEFYRDRSLNANTVVNERLGLPRDPFHFHQFGGFVGGPFVRKKLSFLASYDSVRSVVANAVSLGLPPGFQLDADAAIAASQLRALDYLRARAGSWSFPFRQDDWLTKLDWQAAAAHSVSVRWVHQRGASAFPGNPQQSRENAGPVNGSLDVVAASLTSALGGAFVNVARLAGVASDSRIEAVAATPMADVFEKSVAVLSVGGRAGSPQHIRSRRVQWSDTVSWLRGRHALKGGVDLLFDAVTYYNAQNFAGRYRFLSLASFGESLAGTRVLQPGETFLQAFSGFGTPGETTNPDTTEYAAFVQDEWRALPSLGVNAGLRYDLQVMAKPPVKNPSPELTAAGLDTSFRPLDTGNLAPRLGLAWSPRRSGNLVVRLGYGLFYAPTPSVLAARAHFLNGVSVQPRVLTSAAGERELIPAYPNSVCGPPDPAGVPPSCLPPAAGASKPLLMLFSPSYREPRTRQASIGVELALPRDVSASVGYQLVEGDHLPWVRDVNLVGPTTVATIGVANTTRRLAYRTYTRPRPLAGFDRVSTIDSGARSTFDGLAVGVRKRLSHHYQLAFSYTLAKATDDNPDAYAVNPGGTDAQLLSDPLNPAVDRAPSVNDRRHRVVVDGTWQLDYAGGLPRSARAILGGWMVAGILTAQRGAPYSGLVRSDLNGDGNPQTDRTPGLGRNTFSLPALVSLDVRLTRTVSLRGRRELHLMAEAFNAFDRANVTAVNTTQYAVNDLTGRCGIAGTPCLVPQDAGLAAFGAPIATAGARVIQLGFKLTF